MSRTPDTRPGFRPLFRRAPGEDVLRQQVRVLKAQKESGQELRPIESKKLADGTAILDSYDRRRFFTRIAGFGGVLLVAGPAAVYGYQNLHEGSEGNDARKNLHEYITELPDTRIKTLLVDRILPLFESAGPQTIERNGGTYEVGPGKVVEQYGKPGEVFGEFFNSIGSEDVVTITKDEKLQIPYVDGFIKHEELAQYPAGAQLAFNLELSPDRPFSVFSTGEIIINRPNPRVVPASQKNLIENIIRNVYIKEVCSFLMFNLIAERISQIMIDAGRPTAFEVIDSQGRKKIVDIVNSSLIGLQNLGGRYLQVIDGGGIILSTMAQAQSDYFPAVADNSQSPGFIHKVASLAIPSDNASLLRNTLEFTLANADTLKQFAVQGDPTTYP